MATDLLLLFGVFLGLLLGGMWIPFAIGIAGVLYLYVDGGAFALKALGFVSWGSMDSFTLTAVPLFILMAQILLDSGVSDRVYRGMSVLVRRLPGGLLQTNVAGCGLFAAISGSSVATAAAIGTVALPQLEARGYDRRLATGTLAAGGTLGILIPPSIALIVYGTFTETSIAKLFAAGVLPGLVLVIAFMIYVAARTLIDPDLAASEREPTTLRDVLLALWDLLPFAALFTLVMGSLYLGWATPTESAAIGCVGALMVARLWAGVSLSVVWRSVIGAARTSAGVLFIVYSAFIFSYAVNVSGIPAVLTSWLVELELGRLPFLLAVFALYTVLGCLVDSLGMMVITVPLLFPILLGYGIDPLWFGVVLVLLIELGQITPPLGLNLFVIQNISAGRLADVVYGTAPFYLLIFAMLGLLLAWPELALWLPEQMSNRS